MLDNLFLDRDVVGIKQVIILLKTMITCFRWIWNETDYRSKDNEWRETIEITPYDADEE